MWLNSHDPKWLNFKRPLTKATAAGVWVDYVWKEKQKHTYVRKTKGGLIVGSGYSE